MAITLVGGNTAISVTGGTSTGYTIPSALSNSAAIASGDIGVLQVNTANSANAIAVAGWTQIGTGNNDASCAIFYRVMTGTESAGWVFTCLSSFATSYNFVVYRGAQSTISPAPTSATGASTTAATGASTVAAGATAILVLSSFSFTGTNVVAPTPSPATTLVQTCATNADRQFLSFFYAASPTSAGSLSYTATWSQNSNWQAVLLILTPTPAPFGLQVAGIHYVTA
jgi:hypothetical protein